MPRSRPGGKTPAHDAPRGPDLQRNGLKTSGGGPRKPAPGQQCLSITLLEKIVNLRRESINTATDPKPAQVIQRGKLQVCTACPQNGHKLIVNLRQKSINKGTDSTPEQEAAGGQLQVCTACQQYGPKQIVNIRREEQNI